MDLQEAKRRILSRESYNDVGRRLGIPPLKLYNLLASDPDIVAAKANGKLNASKRYAANHFSKLPHVIDVLQNGMTHTEAAEKHGKHRSQVSRDVKKAQEEGGTTTAPPPPQPESQQAELSQLKIAVRAAVVAGQTKEQILTTVLASL